MKSKIFLFLLGLLLSYVCHAQLPLAEVVKKVPTESVPFAATKKTPFLKRLNFSIDNSSGAIPDRLYEDVQCKEFFRANEEQGAEFFRKFAIPNSANVLMAISFGGVTDWQTRVLCVVNPIGNIISTLEVEVLYYPYIAVKQFRINAQNQIIVTTIKPTSAASIPLATFTSFSGYRQDVTYSIDAQGQFVQTSQQTYSSKTYTRSALESQSINLWEMGGVQIADINVWGIFIGGTYTKAQVQAQWGAPTKYWSEMSEFGLDEEYKYSNNLFRFSGNGIFVEFHIYDSNFPVYTAYSERIKVGDKISKIRTQGRLVEQNSTTYHLYVNGIDAPLILKANTSFLGGLIGGEVTQISFTSPI